MLQPATCRATHDDLAVLVTRTAYYTPLIEEIHSDGVEGIVEEAIQMLNANAIQGTFVGDIESKRPNTKNSVRKDIDDMEDNDMDLDEAVGEL